METEKKSYDKFRCNLYLPSNLVEEVDEMAKEFGTNRSVMVGIILKTYMDQQEIVKLSKLAQAQQK